MHAHGVFFFWDGSAGVTGINVKQVIGANSRGKVKEGWLVGVTSRVWGGGAGSKPGMVGNHFTGKQGGLQQKKKSSEHVPSPSNMSCPYPSSVDATNNETSALGRESKFRSLFCQTRSTKTPLLVGSG